MIPIVTPVVSVCVCLCHYEWKHNDVLHCWGLCVCVSVFRLFTMVVFVVKTKAIITITSASFSDHKTTNTHEPPPPASKSPPDTRVLRREREGKKEGEKEAREGEERSSLSGAFFLPWGGQWSVCEERKRNYLLQFRHHCNKAQRSLWSEWTSICAALSWRGFDSAVSMFPVKQPWLCKALGDLRCIIFSHRLETTELRSWAFWGLSFVWLLLVKLLKKQLFLTFYWRSRFTCHLFCFLVFHFLTFRFL